MKIEFVKLVKDFSIEVTEDTQFILLAENFNFEEKILAEFIFKTHNVSAEIIGMFNLKNSDTLNLETRAIHFAQNTSCDTKIKVALNHKSFFKYLGKIIIKRNAQKTNSFLHDSVLVLGNETKNISEPMLEIEADDVKASHGATTGRVNAEQVFFLQSRGFTKIEAEQVITQGFFESLVGTIVNENARKKVLKNLCLK